MIANSWYFTDTDFFDPQTWLSFPRPFNLRLDVDMYIYIYYTYF